MGAKADHEGMRKQSRLIFCYLYKNLVVIGEMVDVDWMQKKNCDKDEGRWCGVDAYFLEVMRLLYHFVVIGT